MKKILEFEDFLENDLELDEAQKAMLRDWITKYEKYFNFHDSGSFIDSIDDITNDAIAQLENNNPYIFIIKHFRNDC